VLIWQLYDDHCHNRRSLFRVVGARLSGSEKPVVVATRKQPQVPLTGLVPVSHAFRAVYTASFEDGAMDSISIMPRFTPIWAN